MPSLAAPDTDRGCTPSALRARAGLSGRMLRSAAEIGAGIAAQAVELRDGSVTWLAPAADGSAPRPLEPHLYGGTAGIALFLAALDHARGTDEHRARVLGALAPLRRKLADLGADPARAAALRLPVGGMVGLGAFVYALLRAGTWLGEPALVREAHAATGLLTPERIAADAHLDVVKGCAGAVLALLALHRALPGPNAAGDTPLALAVRCAGHLLERRAATDGGPRAWPAPGLAPLTGFAHGASGIGFALLRLYAETGDARLREAALEGFAYERGLYVAASRDWWDPRFGRLLSQNAWCYGAPGMALARLQAVRRGAADEETRGELGLFLELARDLPDIAADHLCCGTLGRAEVLSVAAAALGDPAQHRAARALGRRVLARAAARGGFALLDPDAAQGSDLGLFSGLAGIGYALLRLARPAALPSPLCLE
jgi:lantibiotic modifying enzyme